MTVKLPAWVKTSEDYERWKKGGGPIIGETEYARNIKLKECSACKAMVYAGERSCPQCGKKFTVSWPAQILLLMLALGFIAAITSPNSDNQPKPKKQVPAATVNTASEEKKVADNSTVMNSAWDGSVWQVKRYLEGNLKDPDSFNAIEWSEVIKTPSGGYVVRCKYRAKNSYGGFIVSNQLFSLDAAGNITKYTDFQQ